MSLQRRASVVFTADNCTRGIGGDTLDKLLIYLPSRNGTYQLRIIKGSVENQDVTDNFCFKSTCS